MCAPFRGRNGSAGRDAFPVKGRSLNSKLSSVPACQSIVKKAIVERLGSRYHLSWLEETGPVHQVQFLLMKDQVSILLDTSGPGLHKRGYRGNAVEAPIRETLAASMVHMARLHSDGVLYDPFCGSGTILVEGALVCTAHCARPAPPVFREKWGAVDAQCWQRERERALDQVDRTASFEAFGTDIDPAAVELTLENAKKAGVGAARQGGGEACRIVCAPHRTGLCCLQSALRRAIARPARRAISES